MILQHVTLDLNLYVLMQLLLYKLVTIEMEFSDVLDLAEET